MGTHNVFVIDTKTHLVTAVIDLWEEGLVGTWPFRLAITPDGTKVYVANMMSENISVIDTALNRVVATIEMGQGVHDVTFTPDGRFAYVDLFWDRIPVVDVASNKVVATVPLEGGGQTYTIAASHDGKRVYVVSQTSGGARVHVIETGTNSVDGYFELDVEVTSQGVISLSPDDKKLYLPSGITSTSYARPQEGVNKVFVVDLIRRNVTTEIQVGGGPISMRLSPDGRRGYVSTFAARQVYVVDSVGNVVLGGIEWGDILGGQEWKRNDLRDMAVSPDGMWLYITGWDADAVLVADLITLRMAKTIELNRVMTQLYEVAVTPDGRWVYVSSEAVEPGAVSSLFAIDAANNSIVDEIVRAPYPSNPYVSRDGKRLYAVSGNRVLVIDVATNTIMREISLGPSVRGPYDIAVLAVQDKAYVTDVRGRDVYVIDLVAGDMVRTIDVGWWPQMVVVSPDGTRAFVSRQNNPHDAGGLVVIDTATDQMIATMGPPTGTGTNGRFDLLAVNPRGNHLYWATTEGINIIEIATNRLLKSIDVSTLVERRWGHPRGVHPSDMAFTSDGSLAYIPCGDAYYVVVLDVATGAVVNRIMDVGMEPVAIVITPDDRVAYVTNKEGESVSVIDLTTNAVVARISTRD